MPRTLLLLAGLALMALASPAARTEASAAPAPHSLSAAAGSTDALQVAELKCAHRRVCRPGMGCAWRKVCKRW